LLKCLGISLTDQIAYIKEARLSLLGLDVNIGAASE